MWELETVDALQALLDRQIVDADGVSVGKVDDVELVLHEDGAPTISALLCGPLALGPRLGGRLGVWYTSIAHRLHPRARPEPVRFDIDQITVFNPRELRLDPAPSGSDGDQFALRTWTREKIITRLPGGSR
jgi:hypothetical protein